LLLELSFIMDFESCYSWF